VTCHYCQGEAKKFGRFQNQYRVVQRYRCTQCGKTFSEEQPLSGLRVEPSKAVQIIKLLAEGCGVRAVSRLADCHTHTVLSVLVETGAACDRLHDKLVRDVKTDAIQIDEF
jgi:transposase-like protein